MEANGTPRESPGSLPAARTEPGEVVGTPGRSFDPPQEGQAEEESFTLLKPMDPVHALEGMTTLAQVRT